jgi:aspartate dehydrogenase
LLCDFHKERKLGRIAVIGLGAIGRVVIDRVLKGDVIDPVPECMALVRAEYRKRLDAEYGDRIRLAGTLDEIIAFVPDVVIEVAGQEAVRELAEPILSAGLDFMIVSAGALVNDDFHARLIAAGERSGARLLVPAGAIAGLDGLGALRLSGELRVRYTSIKPPDAWRGTPAEAMIDLSAVSSATTFFSGPAKEAARLFPKNANLAATIALAGAGLQETLIELVADPNASGNCGRIEATGVGGQLFVELAGPSMPDNPKTSIITAYSILNALSGQGRTIVF